MKAIVNGNIVLENGIVWDGIILIDNDHITSVGRASEIKTDGATEIIDAKGAYIGPGFVDIHVHGGNGEAFFGGDIAVAAQHFLKHGETTVIAAATTKNTYEGLLEGIRNIKAAMKTQKNINFFQKNS